METRVDLSRESLSCSICLDLLKDPVALPCGHTYCKTCVEGHWQDKNIYKCPQCRQKFRPRPVLQKNILLAELVEERKKKQAAEDVCSAGPEDVACDVCTGRKTKALKSCLVCLVSYCQEHLQPHLESPAFRRHKLVQPSKQLQEMICSEHEEEEKKMFCRSDQQLICSVCVDQHKDHDIVSAAAERREREKDLGQSQGRIQQKIRKRKKEEKLLQQKNKKIRVFADEVLKTSQETLHQMIQILQRTYSDVEQQVRSLQETEAARVRGLQEQLEQEISELKKKEAELKQLLLTDSHIVFLQNWTSLSEVSEDTTSLSEVREDTTSLSEVREDTTSLLEVSDDTTSLSEVSEDTTSLSEVREDTTSLSEVREDTTSLLEVSDDTTSLSEVSEDTISLVEVREDTTSLFKVREDTITLLEVSDDTTSLSEVSEDTISPVEVWEHTTSLSEVREDTTSLLEVREDTTSLSEVREDTTSLSEVSDDTTSLSEVSEDTTSSMTLEQTHRRFEEVTADLLRETWTNISLMIHPEREQFLTHSQDITLDPNTAELLLMLSEGNRKVTNMGEHQPRPDHPDRFNICPQVLSQESLTGRCYWEVKVTEDGEVAVSYKNISRSGDESGFGYNDKSWSLYCYNSGCSFIHDSIKTSISRVRPSTVGVYLDHSAGLLSFYSVSETMTLLHTVQTRFTEPLHAGVNVWSSCEFVKLK